MRLPPGTWSRPATLARRGALGVLEAFIWPVETYGPTLHRQLPVNNVDLKT
jgi:hypothetical protein